MEKVQLAVLQLVKINVRAESTSHYICETFVGFVELPENLRGLFSIVGFGVGLESTPSCIPRQLYFQNGRAISSIYLSNLTALCSLRGYTTEEFFFHAP